MEPNQTQKNMTEIENSIIADIVSGKYKNFYLIYDRKSTDDTNNQKNSIKYQKSENSPNFC